MAARTSGLSFGPAQAALSFVCKIVFMSVRRVQPNFRPNNEGASKLMSSPKSHLIAALATLALLMSANTSSAQDAAKASALSYDAHSPTLKWGSCPEIFPASQCQVTVLHGDPAKENADVFLKVAPNTKLVHHWHTSAERMILVAGELKVTYDGQPPVLMQPGMYAYGPPKLAHTAECLDGD